MDARDVILRPIITEQSMYAMEDKKYTFEVNVRAKKPTIKKAVEELFDVKVDKVNVINTARKPKRMGRYEGYTKRRRKAIVTLTADSKDIQIFGDED
ncbi:50S ribosomal protein L23 [Alkalibacterium sp. MB6]|uniref:50S ribosomal protein L23 n=1 Tax=Alkalibacterium sp. MB6 TaxID=2081965 RepID=UPI0013797DCA|nr:50S ribosomal protein L23 [Alkalibacterium sp. MB6]